MPIFMWLTSPFAHLGQADEKQARDQLEVGGVQHSGQHLGGADDGEIATDDDGHTQQMQGQKNLA
jgi:hypothetical protein